MKTLFLATAALAIARRPPRGGDHTQQGMKEKAPVERFETVIPPRQSVAVSIPRVAGEAPARIALSNAGGHLHTAEPPAWGFAQ